MPKEKPNFGQYLSEIQEYGEFETQAEAADYIGISQQHYSLILNGKRTQPTWDIGNRIINAHAQIMDDWCNR